MLEVRVGLVSQLDPQIGGESGRTGDLTVLILIIFDSDLMLSKGTHQDLMAAKHYWTYLSAGVYLILRFFGCYV